MCLGTEGFKDSATIVPIKFISTLPNMSEKITQFPKTKQKHDTVALVWSELLIFKSHLKCPLVQQ